MILNLLIWILITSLITSNIVSTKVVDLWFFQFDWWTLLFPISYIVMDIIGEVYWFSKAKKIILIWLICNLIAIFYIQIIWFLPSATEWSFQQSYIDIFSITPRIFFASIVAYLIWEFVNVYILARLKILYKEKYFLRFISSSIIWQLLDSTIFILIAFVWVFWTWLLLNLILTNFILKTMFEIIFSPISIFIAKKIKKIENIDITDKDLSLNMFKN